MSEKNEQWAIVELFGHARIAGRISEQTYGGQSFVRVDVPEITFAPRVGALQTIAAHTRSFGAGAIYSINWVDERAARIAAVGIRHQPVDQYSLESALRAMTDRDRQSMLAAPVVAIESGRSIDDEDPPY